MEGVGGFRVESGAGFGPVVQVGDPKAVRGPEAPFIIIYI
jgi:hypothetical protein